MVNTIHDFGKLFWDIAGILRQEGLPSWQYVEEFSYFLFLKLFDEKEIEREKIARIDGKEYKPIILDKFRFQNWAEDPENWARSQEYRDIRDFLKDMFSTLAKLDREGNQERRIIAKIFKGHEPKIKKEKTLSELVKRIADLKLRGVPYDLMKWKIWKEKGIISDEWFGIGPKPDKQKCFVIDVETIRENDYYLNANRYAPYKIEEVEYEDPVMLMEELISKQEEILKGMLKLKELIGGSYERLIT